MRQWSVLFFLVTFHEIMANQLRMNHYHTHEEMTSFLKNYTDTYSNLTKLYSIGHSYQGRELLVVRITGKGDKILRPNLKLVGNIHGNEPVGGEVLLHFIKYLVDNYNNGDVRVRRLLDYAQVHILPSMNPDGFALALDKKSPEGSQSGVHPHCLAVIPGRFNSLQKDLNRNFPDFFHPDLELKLQSETLAVMNWMKTIPFVLSGSLHGGHLVAIYPFDSGKEDIQNEPNLTEDNDVFEKLARVYAQTHPTMHLGEACPNQDKKFPGGITNGAQWYPVIGSMQDYNYITHGCMEITLEVSCCKFPEPANLSKYWDENREPLLTFLEESRRGIRGLVVDVYGTPVPNASITILERQSVSFNTTTKGEFWRILLPGSYILLVQAVGFENKDMSIRVEEPIVKWEGLIAMKITMFRIGSKKTYPSVASTDNTTGHTTEVKKEHSSEQPRSKNEVLQTVKSASVAVKCSSWLLILPILYSW